MGRITRLLPAPRQNCPFEKWLVPGRSAGVPDFGFAVHSTASWPEVTKESGLRNSARQADVKEKDRFFPFLNSDGLTQRRRKWPPLCQVACAVPVVSSRPASRGKDCLGRKTPTRRFFAPLFPMKEAHGQLVSITTPKQPPPRLPAAAVPNVRRPRSFHGGRRGGVARPFCAHDARGC